MSDQTPNPVPNLIGKKKIFLSWSGNQSREVALMLKTELKFCIQALDPFISRHIEAGTRWSETIHKELDKTNYGIFCITAENHRATWLNYEAGAIGKFGGRVAGLLIGDIRPTDISEPLSHYQLLAFTRDDLTKMLKEINQPQLVENEILEQAIEARWNSIEAKYNSILESQPINPVPERTDSDINEEILLRLRRIEEAISNNDSLASKRVHASEGHQLARYRCTISFNREKIEHSEAEAENLVMKGVEEFIRQSTTVEILGGPVIKSGSQSTSVIYLFGMPISFTTKSVKGGIAATIIRNLDAFGLNPDATHVDLTPYLT